MSEVSSPTALAHIARIFRSPQLNAAEKSIIDAQPWQTLTIGDHGIRFLCDALQKGARFQTQKLESGAEIWRLRFFIDSRFELDLWVWLVQLPEPASIVPFREGQYAACSDHLKLKKGALLDVARAIWQQEQNDASITDASMFMRGTKSLKLDDYLSRAERLLAIDPRGISFFAKQDHAAHIFRRYLVLLALLKAYQLAIEQASQQLADWAEVAAIDPKAAKFLALESLRRDCLLFAARYLFARPVRLDTVDLRYVWDDLAQAQHLQDSQTELNDQLSAMHALLADEEQHREEAADKRRDKLITTLGMIIAVLSLLGLASVTKETVLAFFQSWFG